MAVEFSCPICSGDLLLAGDERAGDEVFCSYCGSPFRLSENPESKDCELEEDF